MKEAQRGSLRGALIGAIALPAVIMANSDGQFLSALLFHHTQPTVGDICRSLELAEAIGPFVHVAIAIPGALVGALIGLGAAPSGSALRYFLIAVSAVALCLAGIGFVHEATTYKPIPPINCL